MTGKDKKMNYPVTKHLRITDQQNANWDYKKVRAFLEGGSRIPTEKNYLKELYDIMENKFELKKDFTPGELETLLKIEEILGR